MRGGRRGSRRRAARSRDAVERQAGRRARARQQAGRVALLGRRRVEHALLGARSDQRAATSTRCRSRGSGTPASTARTSTIARRRSTRTAGCSPSRRTRRKAFAIDPATGKTLWQWGIDEGIRWQKAPRQFAGRGLAYWTDGTNERVDRRHAGLSPRDRSTRRPARAIRSSARTASSISMDGLGFPLVPLAVDDTGPLDHQRGVPGAQGEARREVERDDEDRRRRHDRHRSRRTARSPTARRRSSSAT